MVRTGVKSVDDLYGVDFTGNLVPTPWFQHIVGSSGKPSMNAALILSEIVYWYRPISAIDSVGNVRLSKKFKADLLQLSYSRFESKFNLSRDQCKRAFDLLENLGLVKRHFKNVTLEDGRKMNNVMYIELFSEKVIEITRSSKDHGWIKPHRSKEESTELSVFTDTAAAENPMTNTQITTEITNIDNTSFYQRELSKVRDQVEYEFLIAIRKSDRGIIDNLVDLITEINISSKKFQVVNGEPMPTDIVRERLSRIDKSVMESVIDKIKLTTRPVTNLRGYLLTTLFNEPVIYETGIEMQVTQDMYRRETEAWQKN